MKKGLPSFFTSLGLIAGCISIVTSIGYGNLTLAGTFIIIAAFFDYIDGFAARLVKNVSEFGKQLDSLADVVSFGVAPSMILYRLVLLSYVKSSPGANFDVLHPELPQAVILFSTFLVAVFSALRLAKFNLDPGQAKNFKGLPVPANALFIAALAFAAETSRTIPAWDIIFARGFLLTVVVVSSFLLVSNIPMFSLKFSTYGIRKNIIRYAFLAISAILLIVFRLPGLAPIILLYVIMSLITSRYTSFE